MCLLFLVWAAELRIPCGFVVIKVVLGDINKFELSLEIETYNIEYSSQIITTRLPVISVVTFIYTEYLSSN